MVLNGFRLVFCWNKGKRVLVASGSNFFSSFTPIFSPPNLASWPLAENCDPWHNAISSNETDPITDSLAKLIDSDCTCSRTLDKILLLVHTIADAHILAVHLDFISLILNF